MALGDELEEDVASGSLLEIEADARLVAIGIAEERRQRVDTAGLVRQPGSERIAIVRRFDLDDLRTEIGEKCASGGAGGDDAEIEHPATLKGTPHAKTPDRLGFAGTSPAANPLPFHSTGRRGIEAAGAPSTLTMRRKSRAMTCGLSKRSVRLSTGPSGRRSSSE